MPPQRPNAPDDLDDFDVCFRLQRPVRRGVDHEGRVVWTPARWQNLVLVLFGVIFLGLLASSLSPWEEVAAEVSAGVLLLAAPFFVLLLVVSLVLVAAGLVHWPRLVLDPRTRTMTASRPWGPSASVRLDEIERIGVDRLGSPGDFDTHVPLSEVLYAVLVDGRTVQIAVFPPSELVDEIRALTRRAPAPTARSERSTPSAVA